MLQLVIYGNGAVAEVCSYYFSKDSDYEVAAFTNDDAYIDSDVLHGKPVVPLSRLTEYAAARRIGHFFVALGYNAHNDLRERRYLELKSMGLNPASYISPRATVESRQLGEHLFIFENNVIQPFVTIESNTILWSGNHIGHHSSIDANCFISSHVVVSGFCRIGRNVFCGVNSTFFDNVTVGDYSVISAGAVVSKDCGENALVLPARSEVRSHGRDIL